MKDSVGHLNDCYSPFHSYIDTPFSYAVVLGIHSTKQWIGLLEEKGYDDDYTNSQQRDCLLKIAIN